jgi:hypothetical protein
MADAIGRRCRGHERPQRPGHDARVLDRLTDALARARSGALDYETDSTASYHTVWFQLHEDLLATIGIPR